jgi:hypothetical protein
MFAAVAVSTLSLGDGEKVPSVGALTQQLLLFTQGQQRVMNGHTFLVLLSVPDSYVSIVSLLRSAPGLPFSGFLAAVSSQQTFKQK